MPRYTVQITLKVIKQRKATVEVDADNHRAAARKAQEDPATQWVTDNEFEDYGSTDFEVSTADGEPSYTWRED